MHATAAPPTASIIVLPSSRSTYIPLADRAIGVCHGVRDRRAVGLALDAASLDAFKSVRGSAAGLLCDVATGDMVVGDKKLSMTLLHV